MNTKLIYAIKRSSYITQFGEPHRIQYEFKEYGKPINYSNNCRYKNTKTLTDDDTGRTYHQIIKQPCVVESDDDEYYTVTLETENRLDLIAYNYYGSANYWWVIGYANYLLDPFDVPIGTKLRIPPITSLYQTGGVLSG